MGGGRGQVRGGRGQVGGGRVRRGIGVGDMSESSWIVEHLGSKGKQVGVRTFEQQQNKQLRIH